MILKKEKNRELFLIQFILGGARSGKSAYAELLAKRAESEGGCVFYIATAQRGASEALDSEMVSRIERHQADRPVHWCTIESSLFLANTLKEKDAKEHCFLVDCLTLWTLNVIESGVLESEKKALLDTLSHLKARVILVSNEVGLGIVPMGNLTRRFVDELGWLHQEVAQVADEVWFVTAGLPMKLK